VRLPDQNVPITNSTSILSNYFLYEIRQGTARKPAYICQNSYLSNVISRSPGSSLIPTFLQLTEMASQTVVSKGIFHGLPTFPEYEGKKLSIIVTGANGISGSAMVKVLSEAPERWNKIYALSRRLGTYPASSNIVSIAVDFLSSTPEDIAKLLKDHQVKA